MRSRVVDSRDASLDDVRDSQRAVERARRAVDLDGRDPTMLDALAAARAETGRFDEAIDTAKRAAALAGDAKPADAINARIALYRSGKPYRDSGSP